MGRFSRAIMVAIVLAGACVAAGQARSQDLVLGAVYPITGPQASGGIDELAGVRAAMRVADQTGALNGRHVHLQVIDVRSPQGAAAAVDRLVDTYHVPAIIGTYGSTLAVAAAARADQRHVFYLETGAVADEVTVGRRYVFRTVATGSSLGRAAVRFTSERLLSAGGLTPVQARAVIVHVNDVYGSSVAAGQAEEAARAGINVVDSIEYDPLSYDPVTIARRVAADHPDYLWDVSYLDDGVAIWRALAAARVPLRAAVGTSSAFCMPAFGQRLGATAVGVFAADKPDASINPAALDRSGRALLGEAETAYAIETGSSTMSIGGVAGFVGGWAFFHDILPKVSGSVSAETLRDAAYRVDAPVGSAINGGGVQFAPSGAIDAGQNRRPTVVVGQWQAGVTMRVVYPASYADASPVIPDPQPAR